MRLLILLLLLLPSVSQANDITCLSEIIYSESRGESVEGAVAIGHASVNRAKRTGKTLCKIPGVTRKKPSKDLEGYYHALSQSIIGSSNDTVKSADSWNTGDKTGQPGKITRKIGNHIFYVMNETP